MFDTKTLEAAAREKEVELTTFGRKSGRPSRRVIWVTPMDGRLYIRSGVGMTREWPKNLRANGRGILHIAGTDVPVQARHVTDPTEARSLHASIKQKYNAQRPASAGDEPLTASEVAVFEILPAEGD